MERKTIYLLLILVVVSLLSIHAGTKYAVDPSEYETVDVQTEETVTEEKSEEPPAEETDEKETEEVEQAEEPTVEETDDKETEEVAPVEGLAITFDSDHVYVEQGSSYDFYEGVTIHDDQDSQKFLWDNIIVQGDPIFDINTVGVYEITYIVTNSRGEEAEATRIFEVVPEGTEIPDSEG